MVNKLNALQDPPAVVTGVGVVSPAGFGYEAFGQTLENAIVHTGKVTRYIEDIGEVRGATLQTDQLYELRQRTSEHPSIAAMMLGDAIKQALHQAGPPTDGASVPIVVSSVMSTRPVLDRVMYAQSGDIANAIFRNAWDTKSWSGCWERPQSIMDVVNLQQPEINAEDTVLISVGCAGVNVAISLALNALRYEGCSRIIVAAVDEFSLEVSQIFKSLRISASGSVKPFGGDRDGSLVGEAATALVIETPEAILKSNANPIALVEAASITSDAHHIAAPDPNGRGLRRAVELALRQSGLCGSQISWVCSHGTGTIMNDIFEIDTVYDVLGDTPTASSIKGHFGHAQGAAAGLDAIAALWAIDKQLLPGTANTTYIDKRCKHPSSILTNNIRATVTHVLSPAFGFGGVNSVAIFGKAV